MYDPDLQKGVRKKTLPSPQYVDFPRSSNYEEVIKRGKGIFFPKGVNDTSQYYFASTSGIPFHVDDPEDWSLGEFLNEHGYQPSKTRFYIVFKGTSRRKV